jgi:glycosyltransferase involved in cell wall biosynthesis
MGSPRISVVLPTYNRRATLTRAVDSVLRQTLRDLELIVVDDGSDDGTAEWLASLEDPRVRVLHQSRRQGAARARNRGIEAACAELIAFQDSDDEWIPYKLERQLALLQTAGTEVGWVGGAYRVQGEIVRSKNLEAGADYDADLLRGAPFVTPTWLVRRRCLDAVGLFDERLPCLEDWDLIFRLADHCRFRAVPDVVLIRHASADSLYADTGRRLVGLEAILTRHRTRWLQAPGRYARWCTECARLHGLHGDPVQSRRWLREARRHAPWQWQAWGLTSAMLGGATVLRRAARSRLFGFTPT